MFPWADKHCEEGEFVVAVKYLVCTKIDGRLRTLHCKRNNLNKHAGWCRAEKDMPHIGVKKGELWRNKNIRHYKNEKLFAVVNKAIIFEKLNLPMEMSWSKNKCQLVVILNMLLIGRSMSDYPYYHDVLSFLNCPLILLKQWSMSIGWGITKCLHAIIQNCIKVALAKCQFISITCDEVTTVDCQTWILVQVYIVKENVCVPMLLTFEKITSGVGVDNLTRVLLEALQEFGVLTKEQIWEKLLCFGANGAVVFHCV